MDVREKLVELLMQKGYGVEGATIAADHLIAHGVTVQGWIPVKDRLPNREDAGQKGLIIAVDRESNKPKLWWFDIVAKYPQEFTHWMPLPEPPKGE